MPANNFNKNALPPVINYDIHIYFEPGQKSETTAYELAQRIIAFFPNAVEKHTPQKVGIVGPHLAHNYEVDLKPEAFGKVVAWLQRNSEGLSILIHPHTGDEAKDHLESSLWLGKQREFNPEFFAKLKTANNNNPKINP